MSRRTVLVLAVAAAAVLAACTDVPSTSDPSVIQSQVLQPPTAVPNPPPHNGSQREIIIDFLAANGGSDPNHQDARQYLTQSENSRWSDDRATVLDVARVGFAQAHNTVGVTGAKLGTVDSDGVYSPVLAGDGSTGTQYKAVFTLKKVAGQWRIDKLPTGVLITSAQFGTQFQQRSLFFFDATEKHLVPDPRFTQFADPTGLANWFVQTLANGPRAQLATVQVNELPAQTNARRPTVMIPSNADAAVKITIPGAAELNEAATTNLAIELAATLAQVGDIGSDRPMSILDGNDAVDVPRVGTTFRASEYSEFIDPERSVPALYYIDAGGGVVDAQGRPLAGRVGNGYYDLIAVALAPGIGSQGLRVAGLRDAGGIETLDVGSESTPLVPVDGMRGPMSRPSWAPGLPEFWIGKGTKLYRVSTKGTAVVVPVSTGSGPPSGTITAVRFSPDGGRVALVLTTTGVGGDTLSSVWIGGVNRGGDNKVSVEGLTQITANGVAVTDVAWNDETKLFGVGHRVSDDLPGIYEFQSDGSRWSPRGIGDLVREPDNITVAGGLDAAVAVGRSVWKQLAGTWVSIHGDGDVTGLAPIYVE